VFAGLIWEDQCDPPSVVAITTGPGKVFARAPTATQVLGEGQATPARSAAGLPPIGTGSFWVPQVDPSEVLTAAP
jgi:hypothetical protein